MESPSSRSPSFFGTIKAKFGKTQGIFGSSQGFESRERESPESSEGKSYFSKTSGQGTAGRTFTAFAWVSSLVKGILKLGSAPSAHLVIYEPIVLTRYIVRLARSVNCVANFHSCLTEFLKAKLCVGRILVLVRYPRIPASVGGTQQHTARVCCRRRSRRREKAAESGRGCR